MGRRSSPRLKKSLGQVFLKTTWPGQRVVEQLKKWHVTRVLEIGPGGGILTRALLEAGLKVTAVEKDDRFAERLADYWQQQAPGEKADFTIVNDDVLKFDLAAWLAESGEPTAIVGNIPYNISTPILMWLMPHLTLLNGVIFLVQLEFAMRLAANPGSKSYGSLSVFAQLRAKVAFDCKVPRNCFQPVPKVDSALVSLSQNNRQLPPKTLIRIEHVTRLAFQQRRKKLSNAIAPLADKEVMARCPIDLGRRPETLSPEEFYQLAKYFYPEDVP